jgi:hypothetical protein
VHDYETVVIAALGGFLGMATALGYGFKTLVDVVSKQLAVQNDSIKTIQHGMAADLKKHIDDCSHCRNRIDRWENDRTRS